MKNGAKKESALQSLDLYRNDIGRIDDQIVSLLSKRQKLAIEIGKLKMELGHDIFEVSREQELFRKLSSTEHKNLSSQAIRSIFSEIISASQSVQKVPVVAYLGPEATFSHQAAISLYGKSASFRATESIEEVFSLVEKDLCHKGIVPIENSYEGSVNITSDLFYQYDLKISAEIFVRIRHHLLSREGGFGDIKNLYVHPMTLGQCRSWIKGHLPGVVIKEVASNSLSAKIASEEKGSAGIGSRLCGEIYELKTLEEDIEDHPDNITRFLVIGKNRTEPTGKDKTSILFFLRHKPGALYGALAILSDRGLNMTRIESRPMKIRNWEYLFFVDVEGHERDSNVSEALKEMGKSCAFLKSLGSYPVGGEPWD
ncbi:prephenate dehydratase [Thermodesulfobacteriota bacterium]